MPTQAAAGASRRRGPPRSHRGLPALLLRAGRRSELRLGGVAAHLGALARLCRRRGVLLGRSTAAPGGLCRCACTRRCIATHVGDLRRRAAARAAIIEVSSGLNDWLLQQNVADASRCTQHAGQTQCLPDCAFTLLAIVQGMVLPATQGDVGFSYLKDLTLRRTRCHASSRLACGVHSSRARGHCHLLCWLRQGLGSDGVACPQAPPAEVKPQVQTLEHDSEDATLPRTENV